MARGFNYAPGSRPEVLAALDPSLTKPQILELGSSRNMAVRAAIATREDCPLGLMVTLAHDYATEVRVAVASNPAAMRSVMQYLAADKSTDVVTAVISNPSLPADILEDLAFHKKAEVRAAATARLNAAAAAASSRWQDDPTPELADSVRLFTAPGPMPRPDERQVEHVPFASTPQPLAPSNHEPPAAMARPFAPFDASTQGHALSPHQAPPSADAPQLDPDTEAESHAVVHPFLAPHDSQGTHVAHRTAPVRGFRPPSQ